MIESNRSQTEKLNKQHSEIHDISYRKTKSSAAVLEKEEESLLETKE